MHRQRCRAAVGRSRKDRCSDRSPNRRRSRCHGSLIPAGGQCACLPTAADALLLADGIPSLKTSATFVDAYHVFAVYRPTIQQHERANPARSRMNEFRLEQGLARTQRQKRWHSCARGERESAKRDMHSPFFQPPTPSAGYTPPPFYLRVQTQEPAESEDDGRQGITTTALFRVWDRIRLPSKGTDFCPGRHCAYIWACATTGVGRHYLHHNSRRPADCIAILVARCRLLKSGAYTPFPANIQTLGIHRSRLYVRRRGTYRFRGTHLAGSAVYTLPDSCYITGFVPCSCRCIASLALHCNFGGPLYAQLSVRAG